jgi:hypothetical protein
MNTNRDQLDDAIDSVARRLTHVEDDPVFASRVIAALPERATWFGWLTHSWAPRLAMIAVIVVAAVLWNNRRTTELPAVIASTNIAGNCICIVDPDRPTNLEPVEPRTRTRTLEPWNPGTLEPFVGLPSVAPPVAIDLASLTTSALPEEDSLSLPSLVIADLPLTAETFPQRD